MRRTRMLQALLEEFPVSAAITLQHDGHAERLDGFFSSPQLHDAVQTRGLLSRAFASYLATLGIAPLQPLRAIEGAIARCRNDHPSGPPAPGMVSLAPTHDILTLPMGSLERYVSYSGLLIHSDSGARDANLEVMLSDGFTLPNALVPLPSTHEYILVEPSDQGPRLGEVSAALGDLLEATKAGIALPELVRVAISLGAEAEEAGELIDELSAEGLLIHGALRTP